MREEESRERRPKVEKLGKSKEDLSGKAKRMWVESNKERKGRSVQPKLIIPSAITATISPSLILPVKAWR